MPTPTPRKPSPLRQVLLARDMQPSANPSETQIAKGSIQAALARAPKSLDDARYIDGLTTVFNRHVEAARTDAESARTVAEAARADAEAARTDAEAAGTDAEAVRTVNKVRLKVIKLSIDTSVEIYLWCICILH